jgi:biotin carboxyl carrier protein
MVTNKFRLVLDKVPYEIERQGEIFLVNGAELSVSMQGGQITVAGTPHTVEVTGLAAKVDGIAYPIEVQGLEEPKGTKVRKASSHAAAEAAGALTAVMPGLIVKILKKEGEKVKAGEVVLVLEAMKMQNDVQAKQDGVVTSLHVKAGDTVEMRQVLAVIEVG